MSDIRECFTTYNMIYNAVINLDLLYINRAVVALAHTGSTHGCPCRRIQLKRMPGTPRGPDLRVVQVDDASTRAPVFARGASVDFRPFVSLVLKPDALVLLVELLGSHMPIRQRVLVALNLFLWCQLWRWRRGGRVGVLVLQIRHKCGKEMAE